MKFGNVKEIRPLLGAKRLLVLITGEPVLVREREITPEVIASFSLGTKKALTFAADQLCRICGLPPSTPQETLKSIFSNPDKYIGVRVRYDVERTEEGYENISVFPETNSVPEAFVDRLFSEVEESEASAPKVEQGSGDPEDNKPF